VSAVDVTIAVTAGLALVLALASREFRKLPLSEPLLALVLGVLIGPQVLSIVDPPAIGADRLLEHTAKVVLAISLMAVALRFPVDQVARHWRPLAMLLTVVLAGMAAVSSLLGLAAGLSLTSAALLGSAIAPTDPVLSSNVVSGDLAERTIPERVRLLVSVESGANDGLAFLFVALAVAAITGAGLPAELAKGLGQLAISLAVGVGVGVGSGRLLLYSERHNDIEHASFLVLSLSLGLFVLGFTEVVGGQGIIGVFVAGLAYAHVISRSDRSEEWEVQEAINRFLILPVFVLFGVALPWSLWGELGWQAGLFVAAVLVLRRLPLLLVARPLLGIPLAEAIFMGWFGPIGVAALYYLAETHRSGAADDTVWAVGTLVIVASTVLHGVSATPGRRLLDRRIGARERMAP
jgi:sodium/hydrogen antiporter